MIYRVTLPNGETLHTGHGPLADVWLNRHGGKLERIPLASIKSVAAEMWDGSPLTAALISVDRLRAILMIGHLVSLACAGFFLATHRK